MIKFYQTLARMRRTLARVMWYLTSTNLPNTQTAGPGQIVSTRQADGTRALTQLNAGETAYPDLFRATTVADGAVLGPELIPTLDFTGWTNGEGGYSVDANTITTVGGGGVFKSLLSAGQRYQLVASGDESGGVFAIRGVVGSVYGAVLGTTEFIASQTDLTVYFRSPSSGTLNIDAISLREVIPTFLPALPDETLCHPRTLTRGHYLNDIYPAREDSTAYAEGDNIKVNRYWYTCTTGGTSAASEPVGYAAGDAAVTDGTAVFAYGGLYAYEFDGGALVEEARTNLLKYSEDFTHENWIGTAIAVTAGAASQSIGNTFEINEGATTAAHYLYGNAPGGTITLGEFFAVSIYAKAGSSGSFQLFGTSSTFGSEVYVNFDLTAGIVGTTGTGATGSIEYVGDGFYRCCMVCAATTTTSGSLFYLCLTENASSVRLPTYLGTDRYIIATKAQPERGVFASSYIQTTTAAITRPATIAAVDSAGVLRANDFAVDMSVSSLGTQDGDVLWSSYTDASNYLSIGINGAAIEFTKVVGGVPATASVTYSPTAGLSFRLQANQSADGMILAIQELGAAWSAWGTDTTAAGKADAVIGPNVETGSEDAAKHYSGGYSNERILWLQPGVNPQTILEGLR